MRLIGRGWRLIYDPGLVVEHRPSLRGRSVAPRIPALRLCNRLIMVRRHLPIPIAAMHAAIWGGRTFREAGPPGTSDPGLGRGERGCERRSSAPPPVAHGPRIHRLRGRAPRQEQATESPIPQDMCIAGQGQRDAGRAGIADDLAQSRTDPTAQ